MTKTVKRDLLDFQQSESHVGPIAVTEASSLGFAPGDWPSEIEVDPKVGNGQTFIPIIRLPGGGMRYHQEFGLMQIDVLND